MGKNKNKNKQKSRNTSGPSGNQTAPGSTSATATPSSVFSGNSLVHRTLDGTSDSPTPCEPNGEYQAEQPVTNAKRDSVISSSWERITREQPRIAKSVKPRFQVRPRRWWPCRVYQRIREFVIALARACIGPRWRDVLWTLGAALAVMFAGYVGLELILSMLKVASAQDTTVGASCSVVYVTVPGPIITVSLINTSPSNPAHGTYYFSVINRTTEWMNSIAPPSRFSTLSTRTPDVTPIISVPITSPSDALSSPSNGLPTSSQIVGSSSGVILPSTSTSQPSNIPGLSSIVVSTPSLTSATSSTLLTSALSSPIPPTTSSVTMTITGIASGGQTTTLTRVTATTVGGVSATSTSLRSSPMTSIILSTLTSTIRGGQTITRTSISTTLISQSPSTDPPSSVILSSLITLTSSISAGSTTMTSTTAITISPSSTVLLPSSASLSTSSVLITITSTIPGGPTTILTRTSTTVMGPSSSVPPASPMPPTTSSVLTTITSTLPDGQTTTMAMTSTTIISATWVASTPSLPSGLSSSLASITSRSTSDGFTISLSNPSSSPGEATTSTIPSVITSTTSLITSGLTTTMTIVSTTPMPITTSPPSSSPSRGSSGVLSSSSRTTPLVPSSSMFSWPSSSTPSASGSRSSVASSALSSSPSSQVSESFTVSRPSVSLSTSTSALVQSSRSSNSLPSLSTLSTTGVTPSLLSASSQTQMSTSTLTLTSTLSLSSPSAPTTSPPSPDPSSAFGTLVPPFNATTSSSSRLNSSSSSTSRSSSSSSMTTSFSSSFTSLSLSSSSSTLNPSTSISSITSSSDTGYMSIQTETTAGMSSLITSNNGPSSVPASTTVQTSSPTAITAIPVASNNTSLFGVRGFTTRVISYGDTAISFVFPTPDITTTVSYWTGIYPTVTGPLPSDLQTVLPTTRSIRQTTVSELPPLQIFSYRTRSFKTVVTTVYDDDGPERHRAKREPAPQILETLVTPMIPSTTPTRAEMSAVEAPGPTSCGESGNFTLNFDDTTVSSTGNSVLAVNGLRNPYHHLFYANGYTDVPDKWEPYPAISQPNIAMFMPLTGRVLLNQPFAGTLLPGEIGAGPRASVSAYWFNACSGYFGCALNGVTPCLLRISGYRYDATLKDEVLVAEQNVTIPACWGYIGCRLTQIFFNEQFRALSGIQFNAYTSGLGIPQVHMMDDLQMAWYNNTCSAGILRIGHQ